MKHCQYHCLLHIDALHKNDRYITIYIDTPLTKAGLLFRLLVGMLINTIKVLGLNTTEIPYLTFLTTYINSYVAHECVITCS